VEPVAAGARDYVDRGAGLTAVLGGEVRRLDLYFADEVEATLLIWEPLLPE